MLIYQRPRVSAGRIAYDFEALPVLIQAEPCLVYGRAIGTAHIGYDGRGAWWLDQLEISNPREPGPNHFEPVASPLFAEIRERLDQYRREEIAGAIEAALVRGHHQRLFDEHAPHAQDRRGAPPHARRRAGLSTVGPLPGRIVTAILRLAGAGVELACLGLFLAGLWAGAEAARHHGALAARHGWAHVASLETGEAKP